MKALGLVFAGILSATVSALAGEPVTGRASVIDGDTIEVHGERIRLNGTTIELPVPA